MSSNTRAPFAPGWVRSASCVVAMVPFLVITMGIGFGLLKVDSGLALLLSGLICRQGLYCLIDGRCPPPSWQVVTRAYGAVMKFRER